MPSSRCVVQGCSNFSNIEKGISLHFSPGVNKKSEQEQWLRFVRTHRANFKPQGRFAVCSNHFESKSFTKALLVSGSGRRIMPGAVPMSWKKHADEKVQSDRSRRKVSDCFDFVDYA
jgi:hypothetical protein